MSADEIRASLLARFCSTLDVDELNDGSFALTTPFFFPDGDGYPVILERNNGGWRFTDRGGSASHLFFDEVELTDYRLNFMRKAVVQDGLSMSENFVLSSETFDELPTPVDLADFVQAVARIGGVTALERQEADRYTTTVRDQVAAWVPASRCTVRWRPAQDHARAFEADLCLEPHGPVPVVMFFVASPLKASNSTVSLMQYQRWNIEHRPMVAYKPGSLTSRSVYWLQNAVGTDEHVVPIAPKKFGYERLQTILSDVGVPLNVP